MAKNSYQSTEMIDQADIICTAEVLSTQSQWKEDHRGKHIYTNVELLVWQNIKGNLQSDYINLEVVGGTVGEITEIVSNTPIFARGEQALLFLRGMPMRVVGGHAGKIPIFNNHVFWNGRIISVEALSYSLTFGFTETLAELGQDERLNEISARPTITSIFPDIGSAGTGTEVTISGTGFGENKDTSVVEFFYKSNEPKIGAQVVSWSDTEIVCTVPVGYVDWYPASAGSGPVTVTTLSGTSNKYPFKVTFGKGPYYWPDENPVVPYYVNENTFDCGGEGEAVIAAAETWNSTGASFKFQYDGSHNSTTASQNEHSEIMWINEADDYLATVYKWTQTHQTGNTQHYTLELIECDIVFNDYYVWSTKPYDPYSDADVETTALHEFGHWLTLRDLYGSAGDNEYDIAKVMYGISTLNVKRELHPDDVTGIHWIYPPTNPPSAPDAIEYPLSDDNGFYRVKWNSSSQASSYQLEHSVDGADWVQVYSGPHKYFDESAGNGQYRYRVAASNSAGASIWQTGDWSCSVQLPWEGSGEPNDPFLVSTAEQLDEIGTYSRWWNKHFKLVADIDLSKYDGREGRPVFHLIAPDESLSSKTYWTGVFDGNGYTISNFTYTSSEQKDVGLFCRVSGNPNAEIKSLKLVDPRIEIEGQKFIGSLVGSLLDGTITDCHINGGILAGGEDVGGLVGLNSKGNIVDCHANVSVSGTNYVGGLVGRNHGHISHSSSSGMISSDGRLVGGLVGSNFGDVIQCYSTVAVDSTGEEIGGLVGRNWRHSSTVIQCWSNGAVSGDFGVGGLVGNNDQGTITQSYSRSAVSGNSEVGGLLGFNAGDKLNQCYSIGEVTCDGRNVGGLVGGKSYFLAEVFQCFWDTMTSGQAFSAGGTGKTTVEMQTANTFLDAGWDFVDEMANGTEDIWWIEEGQDYPRLWWELLE